MGLIADRLDSLRVHASVMDGGICGELQGRTTVRITVAPWVVVNDRGLERHFESLARLLWAARMRAYFAAVSEAFGERVTREPVPVGSRDVAYRTARDGIVARGSSRDGRVVVEVLGMRQWRVAVRGAADTALGSAAQEAAEALIRDQIRQVRGLKRTIWHPVCR